MAFTSNDDLNIIQASDSAQVSAGAGNDTYILTPDTIAAGQEVTITDTEGTNTLQFLGGLAITSSSVTNDALQLTLNNGAVVTLLGASAFGFSVGGSVGTPAATVDYTTFAQDELGVTVPAAGDDAVVGGEVTVGEDGGDTGTPGDSLSLTTGVDEITGTANDDVISASLDQVTDPANGNQSQVQTLTAVDLVDGGEGTDRLNARLIDSSADGVVVDNVEQLYLRSTNDAATLDASGVSGAEQVWSDRSSGDLTVSAVQNAVTVGVVKGNGSDYSVAYEASTVGADFTQNVVLNDADVGTLTIADGGTAIAGLNITLQGGENEVATLAGDLAGVTSLEVSGEGDLDISGTALVDLETLNAAAMSGALQVDLTGSNGAANPLEATFGTGNDVVNMNVDDVNAVESADFGDGLDTLILTDGGDTASLTTYNAGTIDLSNVEGLELLLLTDNTATGADGALVGLVDLTVADEIDLDLSGINAALFEGAVSGDGTLALEIDGAATVELSDAVQDVTFSFSGTASGVTVETGEEATVTNATFAGEALGTLTVDAQSAFEATIEGGLDEDGEEYSLTTLTLDDSNSTNGVAFDLTVTETYKLTAVDLTAVSGSATIDASGADFEAAVAVTLGAETDLDYTADAGVRETFTLGALFETDIEITGFEAGATSTRDQLDFGGTAATVFNDLVIEVVEGNTVITAADDADFAGSVTLMGVTDVNAVEASIGF